MLRTRITASYEGFYFSIVHSTKESAIVVVVVEVVVVVIVVIIVLDLLKRKAIIV